MASPDKEMALLRFEISQMDQPIGRGYRKNPDGSYAVTEYRRAGVGGSVRQVAERVITGKEFNKIQQSAESFSGRLERGFPERKK